ncbi:uncharacterized protein LOC111713708 isoform X2 [Eurytemora carolleeae]|uniref:uncharacterized protein LOC111713708 isoform X2 n=1 Tax=Eurytemora carolleeae TaxID=1294199 RepID=UPI000C7662D7|nr:uncharacterized protein LOC111713708 isoform X2 [Eurytemora carolleeae]|eukprot:XP_023344412.1 uncharacterized protein LOC111713708 isoform X2 [Eurytemora affinis]
MSTGRKILTICSQLKEIESRVKVVCPQLEVVHVDPPLLPIVLQQTDYLIADFNHLAPILFENPDRLKWVQGTWAGADYLVKLVAAADKLPVIKVSRLTHPTFSQLMAEYCVSAVINIERGFKQCHELQRQKIWAGDRLNNYRSLNELTIGILGVGEIGSSCAKLLHGFGCQIIGLVNSPRLPDHYVSKYYCLSEVKELLRSADYIINVLPSTPQTNNILSNDVLSACQGSGFINIGRGNVCTDQDIISALNNGWLKEAYLDVFSVEPLPLDSGFWTHPRVTVTPHVAGSSRTLEIVGCFMYNLLYSYSSCRW